VKATLRGVRGRAPLAIALGIACVGCAAQPVATAPATDAAARAASQASGDDVHAIRGAELHATMQELDRVRRGRLPQELDEGRASAFHTEEVSRIARALADAAAEIESTAPLATLDASDRDEFHRLASALRERAAALAADASILPAADLSARFAEIDATCDGCHRRYRDPPKTQTP
jgi:cytochrome c556